MAHSTSLTGSIGTDTSDEIASGYTTVTSNVVGIRILRPAANF